MGKNLKGKELGAGIYQRKDGRYSARFVTSTGKRIEKYFPMLQEARKWLAEAKLNDENGAAGVSMGMTVDAWYDFWIVNIKGKTVRYNTVRNYRERYKQNIKKHIGKMLIADVKPMHCQKILGHSSINITMNLYVHVTDEEKTKEMQKFEAYASMME